MLLVFSCKTVDNRNYKKEAKVKRGYLNGVQYGNKDLKKKYVKKFHKLKSK